MTLQKELERQARSMGARFFGVADLAVARGAIVAQGGEFLAAYLCALSMGVALSDGVVDQLPRHEEVAVARTYDRLFDMVNWSLDRIALRLSITLNEHGFRTFLIPASDTVDDENLWGLFSHKLAARLAGLGWVGPSCLLVTPEVGPRVRWVTVLTDAPLEAGCPIPDQCGDCRRCVEACPPRAFSGRPFDPGEPREARFDVHRCKAYRAHLRDEVTGVRTCGMCVYVCPHGQKEASV
jgi:epoxyqueuosine reductase QueG